MNLESIHNCSNTRLFYIDFSVIAILYYNFPSDVYFNAFVCGESLVLTTKPSLFQHLMSNAQMFPFDTCVIIKT